jgi:hypothetical protein
MCADLPLLERNAVIEKSAGRIWHACSEWEEGGGRGGEAGRRWCFTTAVRQECNVWQRRALVLCVSMYGYGCQDGGYGFSLGPGSSLGRKGAKRRRGAMGLVMRLAGVSPEDREDGGYGISCGAGAEDGGGVGAEGARAAGACGCGAGVGEGGGRVGVGCGWMRKSQVALDIGCWLRVELPEHLRLFEAVGLRGVEGGGTGCEGGGGVRVRVGGTRERMEGGGEGVQGTVAGGEGVGGERGGGYSEVGGGGSEWSFDLVEFVRDWMEGAAEGQVRIPEANTRHPEP